MVPESLTKTYTVNGINSYIKEISEISDESLKEMQSQAEEVYQDDVVQNWGESEKLKSLTYMGNYLLVNKKNDDYWGSNNILYLVYQVQVEDTYSNKGKTYTELNTIYWYICFYDLLVDLTKIEGLKRLRISSIETSQITDDIIDLISKSKIIVDHLHVPLQAGCDETLKRMNRKYNCEQYYEKLSKIRRLIPDIVFTTDVIVGFPGESEEEFEKTYEFIKKVGYTQLHVFPYSMRKGTPAARMVQVDEKIKHERVNRLIALSHELNENYAKSQIGKTLRVLFEKEDHGYYVGHGDNYLLIKVQSDEQLIGQLKNVIINSYDEMLIGRVV